MSDAGGSAEKKQAEPEASVVLEFLDRIAAGERLVDTPAAMGLSEDRARAIFSKAAEIVRHSLQPAPQAKRPALRETLPNWRDMTVTEALEILGRQGSNRELEPN